jgi:hypothetical protein
MRGNKWNKQQQGMRNGEEERKSEKHTRRNGAATNKEGLRRSQSNSKERILHLP